MVVQGGEFEIPPCGRCHGKLVSSGDGLYCLSCGHEPNLARLGLSKDAMDPLRLMLAVMALDEQVQSTLEELDFARQVAGELASSVAALKAVVAGIPVPSRLKPVKCPMCGQRCRSAQGLVSHRRVRHAEQSA